MRTIIKLFIPLFVIMGIVAAGHYVQYKKFIGLLLNNTQFEDIADYKSHYSDGYITIDSIEFQKESLDSIDEISVPLQWNNVLFVKPVHKITITGLEAFRTLDADFSQQIQNLFDTVQAYNIDFNETQLSLNTPLGLLDLKLNMNISNIKSDKPIFEGSLSTKQYSFKTQAKFKVQTDRRLNILATKLSFTDTALKLEDHTIITRAFGSLIYKRQKTRSPSFLSHLKAWKSGYVTAGLVKTKNMTLSDLKARRVKDNFLFRFRLPAPYKTEIEGYIKNISSDAHIETLIKANSIEEMHQAVHSLNAIGSTLKSFQIVISDDARKTIEKEINENRLQELLISVFGPPHKLEVKITSVTESIYGDVRKHVISLDGL